jgi:N-hydroxyarylamine O-acetyltransferase
MEVEGVVAQRPFPMGPSDSAQRVERYLLRLGMAGRVQPDLGTLYDLHAAHAERIPYETLDIHIGRPTSSIAARDSVDRVLRQRGGYCYHLNGAFSLLLRSLGYDVVWHRAGVQGNRLTPPPGSRQANHLALTVHGLPSHDNPAGDWLVDVGLGDAMHAPIPLQAGTYQQPPFRFTLRPSETDAGGWRFDHDPAGSFVGMDFRPEQATLADFVDRHEFLWNSPESGFTKVCSVQRRDAQGVDLLTGLVLSRKGQPATAQQVLDTAADWFDSLADVFGLELTDVTPSEREVLWARVHAAHEVWSATQAD